MRQGWAFVGLLIFFVAVQQRALTDLEVLELSEEEVRAILLNPEKRIVVTEIQAPELRSTLFLPRRVENLSRAIFLLVFLILLDRLRAGAGLLLGRVRLG